MIKDIEKQQILDGNKLFGPFVIQKPMEHVLISQPGFEFNKMPL